MHLVPTQEEVVALLEQTGALRRGHFEYPGGLHASEHLQVLLAMRYYQHAEILSVGLSRLVRANPEIGPSSRRCRSWRPPPGTAGRLRCVKRARTRCIGRNRKTGQGAALPPVPGAGAGREGALVDDILRTGAKLSELKRLVEADGAEWWASRFWSGSRRGRPDFSSLPFYLAKLDGIFHQDAASCDLCKQSAAREGLSIPPWQCRAPPFRQRRRVPVFIPYGSGVSLLSRCR
jgi:orotate phosphoribosyltransferase